MRSRVKACPICKEAQVLVGKVILLFRSGRLWTVSKAIGHFADVHHVPIPPEFKDDVVSGGLIAGHMVKTLTRIDHRPEIVLPGKIEPRKERTVPTGFENMFKTLLTGTEPVSMDGNWR